MKVNHNMSAVITNKQLLRTENKVTEAMERLSSGLKINHSKDNPAGMAISNKLNLQIEGLDQASQNASDGISVLQTTDGALNEVTSLIQRMRELSVQAASDSNTPDDKKAIQQEVEELKKEKLLFVCGGVGTAPVYPQVKWMKEHGIDVDVIIGARTKDIMILENEMREVAGNLYIATDDGSYGFKGNACDQINELVKNLNKTYTRVVAIGPMIMMKFVAMLTKELNIPTIVSMNPIMVDGTGMCGACRLKVGDEIKFACVDGPEFDGHLVDFDQAMRRQRMYKTEEGRAMLKLEEGDTHHGGCGQCNG